MRGRRVRHDRGAPRGDRPAPDRYWPCPACHRLRNRVNFAYTAGVILEVCAKDRVWLGPDPLRRIVEFLRRGGLERARREDGAGLDRRRIHEEAEARAEWIGPIPLGERRA